MDEKEQAYVEWNRVAARRERLVSCMQSHYEGDRD